MVPYIESRVWHPTQSIRHLADGSLLLAFDVCTDAALRGWILSFGPSARVRSPGHLATAIADQLAQTRTLYALTDRDGLQPTPTRP